VFVVCLPLCSGVTVAERRGLEDLYSALNGRSWVNNKNWMSGDPCVDG